MIRVYPLITALCLAKVHQNHFEGHAFVLSNQRRHNRLRHRCSTQLAKTIGSLDNREFSPVVNTSASPSRPGNNEILLKPQSILPQLHTYQKPRQIRRPSTNRHPRNYWYSTANLQKELTQFWTDHNVPLPHTNSPPIPSEYILNFFGRNDLRWGIVQNGGRENVSHLLGGAKIVPGRWKDALELEEVKYLLPLMAEWQSEEDASKVSDEEMIGIKTTDLSDEILDINKRLIDIVGQNNHHRNATIELKSELWTKEKVVAKLYRYLENYKRYKHRPSVWMPQTAELSHEGYSALFNACCRFDILPAVSVFSSLMDLNDVNSERIEHMAGLVPYKEWRYFDSQLQLFVELKQYLEIHHNSSEDDFPDPVDVLNNGHTNLHQLIRIHGGKVLLAQKLSMKLDRHDANEADLNWGPFTLNFAIRLLHFIRSEFMKMSPPLAYPMISMPLEQDLLRSGQNELASLVVKYGGYENVARRLGLAYFDGKSRQMNSDVFKAARSLWRHRNSLKGLAAIKTSEMSTTKKKRKGIAWNKDLVVDELHAYLKVNMTKRSLAPVWMPKFSQFDVDGRGDLKNAISKKCGGMNATCEAAGLVPYSDWTKFESFRELVSELYRYNKQFSINEEDGERAFKVPKPSQLTGFPRLSELIRLYCGSKAVRELLLTSDRHELSSLAFLVELTEFMRLDMMSREPPFSTVISLPTKDQLLHENRTDLVVSMNQYGGYEAVAKIIPGISFS